MGIIHESESVSPSVTADCVTPWAAVRQAPLATAFSREESWSRQSCPGFPSGSDSKEPAWNMGDPGLIPRLGRSRGEGNGYPLQYSCLENSTDRATCQATVYGVIKSHSDSNTTETKNRLYDPLISFLDFNSRERKIYVHAKICTWMFTAALLLISKDWKQS